jgi:GNAT superfamily N-acetyltransferase
VKRTTLRDTSGTFDLAPTAAAWTKGWTLTRNKSAPLRRHYGYQIDLGLPDHLQRHVVIDNDADQLRKLIGDLRTPGTWRKVCAAVEDVAPLLHERWQVQEPEYLMAVTLGEAAVPTTDGYRLSLSTSDEVTQAEFRDRNGELAAKGHVAHHDGTATFDQIVTEPAHQRKGLGRAIMAALTNQAIAHGARTGVLVATQQGQALYQTIGWTLVSPVVAAVII